MDNQTPEAQEATYQSYESARDSMQMITDTGKRIKFIGKQYITDDQDCIEYLNEQIKRGLKTITKGKLLTALESNPMEALKAAHFEEFQTLQIEAAKNAALGVKRDAGEEEGKGGHKAGAPLNTSAMLKKQISIPAAAPAATSKK